MTARQRTLRMAYWRGSAITLLLAAFWMLASAYAAHITQ